MLLKSITDAVSELLHLKPFQTCKYPAKSLTWKKWTLVNVASSRTKGLPGMKTFAVQSCSVPAVLSHIHTLGTSDPEAEIPWSQFPGMPIYWIFPNKSRTHKQCPNQPGPTSVGRCDIVRTHTKERTVKPLCYYKHSIYLSSSNQLWLYELLAELWIENESKLALQPLHKFQGTG